MKAPSAAVTTVSKDSHSAVTRFSLILFVLDAHFGDKHATVPIGTVVFRTRELARPRRPGRKLVRANFPRTAKKQSRAEGTLVGRYANASALLCFDHIIAIGTKNYAYMHGGSLVPQPGKENQKDDREPQWRLGCHTQPPNPRLSKTSL